MARLLHLPPTPHTPPSLGPRGSKHSMRETRLRHFSPHCSVQSHWASDTHVGTLRSLNSSKS